MLVDRDLTLVALHLAEIGIHGGIERIAAEPEPQVKPGVGVEVFPHEVTARSIASFHRGGGHERLGLHRHPVVHVVESANAPSCPRKLALARRTSVQVLV